MKKLYLLFLFMSALMLGQSPNYKWAKTIGGTGFEYGNSVAVDNAGNCYVTGKFEGSVDFDPSPATASLTSSGQSDVFVAKYDALGNYMWAFKVGGVVADAGNSITLDASGNILIAGDFQGIADFDPSVAVANFTALAYNDVFVAKYDANGNYKWALNMRGSGYDYGYCVASDQSRNVYVTGRYTKTSDFDPSTNVANLNSINNSIDIFVAKYDSAGNYLWAKNIGGKSSELGYGIALDKLANVYVTGLFQDTCDFDPSGGISNQVSKGGDDFFLLKLDKTGNYLWSNAVGGKNTDYGSSLAIDAGNNVYVAGRFSDTADFDPAITVANRISNGSSDSFLAKYDSLGIYKWANGTGGTSFDYATCVRENSGKIYVTGTFVGTVDFDPSPSVNNLTASGNDIFVQRFDALGNLMWAKNMGGTNAQEANAIACGSGNNIYLSGFFLSAANFDGNTFSAAGGYDFYVAKYEDVYSTLGIPETGNSLSYKVYPNPSPGKINVCLAENAEDIEVNIRSATGQLIHIQKFTSASLFSLEINEAPGIYLVEIKTDKNVSVAKVIKN